jgi:hypothetical protein
MNLCGMKSVEMKDVTDDENQGHLTTPRSSWFSLGKREWSGKKWLSVNCLELSRGADNRRRNFEMIVIEDLEMKKVFVFISKSLSAE